MVLGGLFVLAMYAFLAVARVAVLVRAPAAVLVRAPAAARRCYRLVCRHRGHLAVQQPRAPHQHLQRADDPSAAQPGNIGVPPSGRYSAGSSPRVMRQLCRRSWRPRKYDNAADN